MTGPGKFNSRTIIASKRLRTRRKKANRIQKKLAQLQLLQQQQQGHRGMIKTMTIGEQTLDAIDDDDDAIPGPQLEEMPPENSLIECRAQSKVLLENSPIEDDDDDDDDDDDNDDNDNDNDDQDDQDDDDDQDDNDNDDDQYDDDDDNVDQEDMVIVQEPTFDQVCVRYCLFHQWNETQMDTFTVQIPHFQQIDHGGFTVFSVEILTRDKQFVVNKRYSEFSRLAVELHMHGLMQHWSLPPKTWFPLTDSRALEQRRFGLEQSLTKLLTSSKSACRLPIIRNFLQLDVLAAQLAAEQSV